MRRPQQQPQQQANTSSNNNVVPPPYRAPPTPLQPKLGIQGGGGGGGSAPYSKFNVSEPNIGGYNNQIPMLNGSKLSPNTNPSFRHTMTNENSSNVQHGLKNMLHNNNMNNSGKNLTLDSQGQNYALHQLRSSGSIQGLSTEQQQRLANLQNQLPLPGDTYTSPDNLRDAANRIFSRNHERSSFSHQQQQQQQQQHNLSFDSDNKRQSYTNQSFRKATGQEIRQPPPTVPPKPRSTSRERSKEEVEVDNLEAELKHILRNGNGQIGGLNGNSTPPLPALSPGPIMSQQRQQPSSPAGNTQDQRKYKTQRPPDLLEGPPSNNTTTKKKIELNKSSNKNEDINSVTTTGLDLESVMGLQTDLTSDDDDLSTTQLDMGDAQAIRKQLDSLEGMYSEVLKMLGLRKYGRSSGGGMDSKLSRRGKLYGSMSSLPSVSSIGSRHLYHKDKRRGDGNNGKNGSGGRNRSDKTTNKRFQRLESHVVTLARSVAHLSSEMRAQQIMLQSEMESIRNEMQGIRTGGFRGHPTNNQQGYLDPENFFANQKVNPVQANRVKKLTKFFGDEPPLLRLFLKNLGYEKYAGVFEESKIGLLELPYLSEERLEKLGVPLGPRMRILQEAKSNIGYEKQQNYSVYIL